LPANAEDIGEEGDGDGLALEGAVHGDEVQDGTGFLALWPRGAVLLLALDLAIVLRGDHGGGCLQGRHCRGG
jgi:hypothetical protein